MIKFDELTNKKTSMQFLELHDRINNAKELDFGTIFNQCIELFKKVWIQGLLTLLLTAVLMIPLVFIMYIPLIAMGIMDPDSFQGGEPNIIFMVPFIVFMLIFMVFAMVITVGLYAAFYRIVKQKDLDEASSDDYFYFLKKKYLQKTIIVSFAYLGIILVSALLCFFPLIYAMIPVSFILVVYAMNPDLSVSEIVNASFKLGNKTWLITFGLFVVAYFMATFVGLILFVVGLYVTQMFMYLPFYQVYKESVGFDATDELDEIGKIENL